MKKLSKEYILDQERLIRAHTVPTEAPRQKAKARNAMLKSKRGKAVKKK